MQWHIVIRWGSYASVTCWRNSYEEVVQEWNKHAYDYDLTSMKIYTPEIKIIHSYGE